VVITSRVANALILVSGIGLAVLGYPFLHDLPAFGVICMLLGLWLSGGGAYNLLVQPHAWCKPSRPLRLLRLHLLLLGGTCALAIAAFFLALPPASPVSEALCRGSVWALWVVACSTPVTASNAFLQHRREYFTRFQSAV